jgi:hypothetical protein
MRLSARTVWNSPPSTAPDKFNREGCTSATTGVAPERPRTECSGVVIGRRGAEVLDQQPGGRFATRREAKLAVFD